MAGAKRAAGDRNVLRPRSRVARLALAAGVLDELEIIHVIPGEGGVTHMRYRVRR